MKKIASLLLLVLALTAWKNPVAKKYDVLITHANIVNVVTGKIQPNQFIAISKGIIQQTGNMSTSISITALKIINVQNKYVMPGLWDNHVHFRGGEDLAQENKNFLPLYLAYGVTTVRDCGGDITNHLLQWRKEITDGTLAGPTIFTSGPKLDGDKPAWAGSIAVLNQKDVIKALDSLQSIPSDFVKIYDGSIQPDAYYAILKEAHQRGMKTTGHMPLTANILDAANLGLNGSEHLYYVLKSCSPKADSLSKLNMGYGVMSEIAESYDPALAEKVYKQLAKKEFFVTPTLYIGQILAHVATDDHSQDQLLPYIGKGIKATYAGRVASAKRAAKSASGDFHNKTEEVFSEMVKPMYDAGINILAGSDCGAFNSYTYPGEAIHGELKRLVKAGLTPTEALKTSFVNGPKFFDKSATYGSITKGKIADLLILDANPLVKIENIDQVNTVIAKGKVYPKSKLDKMLAAVKN
ncbi:MAG: amidohydrolase family protein [Bacteroidetes bacterium]|nr:amidohydrolase family protein [Bacteroidota bacterium]MBU1372880.1 amidohydrolase family protein [Bacteroidota bacterium]MBU1485609.1 amidohydrolase family protein [Bacteroidota bacterium]MBU1761762.1 amidohydrolase family protein [Bacteroidota bacterium]MBU2268900.1 amidohydrolase family protein [Bacteroidota bacterium]